MTSAGLLILVFGLFLMTLAGIPEVGRRMRGSFYGWYVLAASMFAGFVGVGARHALGLFVIPMSQEFGWSRATISLAGGLGVLVNGLTQPFLGMWFDRYGRRVILVSLIVLGLSTMALSLTFHILFLAFMFGIVASTALSGASPTNTGALLSRWFRRRRATVVGLNGAGTSIGVLLLVPFTMFLLQATGNWRITWVALGLITLSSFPLAFMFLRNDPAERGLQPDGDQEQPRSSATETSRRVPAPLETDRWAQPFRSAPFWQMSMSYVVCGVSTLILAFHFVAFAQEDRGISPGLAASIFALMGGLNTVGGVGAGVLSDRFTRKDLLALAYFVRGMAYMVLLVPPLLGIPVLSGHLGVWLFAVLMGLSWNATPALTTALTADVYGLRALGTISGTEFMFHQLGGFSSVLLAGFLRDLTGSYTIPFLTAGLLLFPAALSSFSIKERKYSVRFQPRTAPAAAATGD